MVEIEWPVVEIKDAVMVAELKDAVVMVVEIKDAVVVVVGIKYVSEREEDLETCYKLCGVLHDLTFSLCNK